MRCVRFPTTDELWQWPMVASWYKSGTTNTNQYSNVKDKVEQKCTRKINNRIRTYCIYRNCNNNICSVNFGS